ncbi:serendipity locus protein H-1 [Bactrocera neohumeralis]|uniref:serendipity locus protein H-1 n=1 Tax=Bactrocera neohumeralis TaxID=98809 RepID=UPI0021651A51|nr:serendipity locus protein H-1 [Bactrocera neohumeralis]
MTEEAPSSKKMPRKPRSAPINIAPNTPTKLGANDEILSSLLRLNNFDSNIKDESLDIDLSACVTISGDSAAMLATTNSLSSTDFWRVLDESAQNAHLELTNASDDVQHQLVCASLSDDGLDDSSIVDDLPNASYECKTKNLDTHYLCSSGIDAKIVGGVIIKEEKPQHSFSGTFLRPEAPPPTPSPLKRLLIKPHQADYQRQAERCSSKEKIKRDLKNEILTIDRAYQLNATHIDDAAVDNIQTIENKTNDIKSAPTNHVVVSNNQSISSSSFNIFTMSEDNTPSGSSNSNNLVPASKVETVGIGKKESGSQESGTSAAEPVFKCLDCDGLILQGRGEYATHEAVGHRVHYRCPVCDNDFEQEAALKKHVKTHRSTDPRKDAWKKCPECGKCLKLGSMWMHRKIHSDNKKYGCDICGQKFVQKINLTHHSRIHTAEKPYECPECQKRFQERSHLQRHQKYHAQTRSYRCEKCGKMYKTERCLKVHNLVHLEQRPFACNVCDKSFISNSKLKQHSNIHTGERPFKCNYCPRDFTNFPNWLKHTRRRHKVDHKTGEHLENIPSYCSKKSTKAAKAKAAEANTEPASASLTTKSITNDTNKVSSVQNLKPSDSNATTPKSQASKRKKKSEQPPTVQVAPAPQPPPLVSIRDDHPLPTIAVSTLSANIKTEVTRASNIMTSIPMSMSQHLKPTTAVGALNNTLNKIGTSKTAKPKRERKQPSPKQVQKAIPTTPALLSSIKRENTEADAIFNSQASISLLTDTRCAISGFPDLSITSAEELIMEQALEMEECGLYVGQPSVSIDTDNAISSSEATAALHFKIKSEFDPVDLSSTRIKEEDHGTLKDMNQRLLCSSLESSPYSSPASIELSTTPSVLPMMQSVHINNINNMQTTSDGANSFGLDPFTLNGQCPKVVTSLNNSLTHQTAADLQHQLPQATTHIVPANTNTLPTTTQAIINHFYIHPMTTMPLLAQSTTNQKLPSVNTLLFSTAGNTANVSSTASNAALNDARYFHGKSITAHVVASPSAAPVGRSKLT